MDEAPSTTLLSYFMGVPAGNSTWKVEELMGGGIKALDGGRVPSPSDGQSTLLPKPSTEQNSSEIGDSHCDAFLHVLPQRNPGLHFLDNFWCPSQNVTSWTLTFSGR